MQTQVRQTEATLTSALIGLRKWAEWPAAFRYTGQADWDYIGQCAKGLDSSQLQLIGNGDVFTWQEYEGRLQAAPQLATAMIARAALIKPWIFTEVSSLCDMRVAMSTCRGH